MNKSTYLYSAIILLCMIFAGCSGDDTDKEALEITDDIDMSIQIEHEGNNDFETDKEYQESIMNMIHNLSIYNSH